MFVFCKYIMFDGDRGLGAAFVDWNPLCTVQFLWDYSKEKKLHRLRATPGLPIGKIVAVYAHRAHVATKGLHHV